MISSLLRDTTTSRKSPILLYSDTACSPSPLLDPSRTLGLGWRNSLENRIPRYNSYHLEPGLVWEPHGLKWPQIGVQGWSQGPGLCSHLLADPKDLPPLSSFPISSRSDNVQPLRSSLPWSCPQCHHSRLSDTVFLGFETSSSSTVLLLRLLISEASTDFSSSLFKSWCKNDMLVNT